MKLFGFFIKDVKEQFIKGEITISEANNELRGMIGKYAIGNNKHCQCRNCKNNLELAYSFKYDSYFWNCFSCYPYHKRVLPTRKELNEITA